MSGRLVHTGTSEVINLGDETTIGRSPQSDVVLLDTKVSRRHAMIRLENEAYWFHDLGSSNGCLINHRRIATPWKLHPRDSIDIAGHIYRFERTDRQSDTTLSGDSPSLQTVAWVRTSPAVIMVSDIRGFTRMSEQSNPADLAKRLGEWYAVCEKIIKHHDGAIDKFIGDAVLACWLEPGDDTHGEALAAARELVEESSMVLENVEPPQDTEAFQCGAALHLGEVAYGGMGGHERTVLGDSVNVTFRLQDLTRTLDCPILLTGEFRDGLHSGDQHHLTHHGAHHVKGRERSIEVYGPEAPDFESS